MTEPVIAGDDFSVFLDPFFFTFPTANENSLAQDYSKATFREVAENEDDAEVEPLKNSFSALKDQHMILDTCRSDVLKLPVIGYVQYLTRSDMSWNNFSWLSSTSPFDTEITHTFLVLDMSFAVGGYAERLFTAIKKMNPDETHSPELQEMWTCLSLSLHRSLRTIYDFKGNSTIVSPLFCVVIHDCN